MLEKIAARWPCASSVVCIKDTPGIVGSTISSGSLQISQRSEQRSQYVLDLDLLGRRQVFTPPTHPDLVVVSVPLDLSLRVVRAPSVVLDLLAERYDRRVEIQSQVIEDRRDRCDRIPDEILVSDSYVGDLRQIRECNLHSLLPGMSTENGTLVLGHEALPRRRSQVAPLSAPQAGRHRASDIPSVTDDMDYPGLWENVADVGHPERVPRALLNKDPSGLTLAREPLANLGLYRWRRRSGDQAVAPVRALTSFLPDLMGLEDISHIGVSRDGLP